MHQRIPRLFEGKTVAILATGPSLRREDVQAVRAHGLPAVAINDAYRLAPWADVLYACDGAWWEAHDYVRGFAGQRWTQDRGTPTPWDYHAGLEGLNIVDSVPGGEVSDDPARIFDGSNSGFQALQFVWLAGARRAILLGYDMHRTRGRAHFFGEHPAGLKRGANYGHFGAIMDAAAPAFLQRLEVWNASRETALQGFPRVGLAELWKLTKI